MPLADLLRHAWRQRGPLARLLWPVSQLYAAAVRRQQRRWAAQPPARADVPVSVVGNVIAGGAGKTPVTLALLEHLRSRNSHGARLAMEEHVVATAARAGVRISSW